MVRNTLSVVGGLLILFSTGCNNNDDLAVVEASYEQLTIASGRAPTVAIDQNSGTTYLAWFVSENDETNIYLASKKPDEQQLSTPVRVNDIPGDVTLHAQAPAQVVVGPEGNVYVVWTNDVPAEGRIFAASDLRFARSVDGGQSFEPATTVNSDHGGIPSGHTFHDIAVGPDGTVFIAWLDSRKRDRIRTSLIESGTMEAAHVESHDMNSKMAAIESESKLDLPGTELWIAASRDGGKTFDEGYPVAEETCNCCRVAVEVSSDGTVYLAWRHIFPNSERDIALASSSDGGRSFSAPTRVHNDAWELHGCPHTGPTVVIDESDRLHIAWYTGVETHPGLYYAMSSDRGESFSSPVRLGSHPGVSQVKMGGTGESTVWLTWEEAGQVMFALANGDGTLTVSSEPAIEGTYPSVAVTDSYWVLTGQTKSDSEVQIRPTS